MSFGDHDWGEPTRRRLLGATGAGFAAGSSGCLSGVLSDDEPVDEVEPTFTHPETVAVDEAFSLEISELPTDTDVQVTATVDDGEDVTWSASATYEVTDGSLGLDEESPIDGPFDEAATTRLIQHMEPVDAGDTRYRAQMDEQLSFEVAADGDPLGSTTLTRTFGDPDVTATSLEQPDLVGQVFEPPGADAGPGVVVLHGSGGDPATSVAHLLASNGFVAVALQYFGAPSLQPQLVEVPIELVDDAARWLLEHDRVDTSQVGLYGASKGGELALLAGSQFESIGPVVGIAASGVAWEGVSNVDSHPGSSWTYGGEPVPYVPYVDDPTWGSSPPRELEPTYTASFEEASADRIDDATIPVEEIDGPVLLVSGGDDRLWDAVELSSVVIDRFEAHDHPFEYEHLVFEDAGHVISPPYRPNANLDVVDPYVTGGTQAGYAEANATFWPRALETLAQ